MSGAEVNLYELLELDPSVLDWPAVEARLVAVRERWARERTQGSPRNRARAAQVLEQLAGAADKLRDDGFRRAQAEVLRRRREGEAAAVLVRLEEAIALLGGGRCSRAQLVRLLAQFAGELPAEAVLERLRAAGIEPPGPRLRPVEGRLEPAEARKLRDQLDLLGLLNLYALLGLAEEAAPEELCRHAEALLAKQAEEPKANAATTARRNLLTAARRLFADAAGKQRYDRQRLYEQVSALDPRLELAGAGGSLGAAQVEALVAAAAALGVPARVARDYVWEVAEENGWRVEAPAGPVPAPEPATRGAEPRPVPGPADEAAARTARPGGAEAGAEARRERAPAALRGRMLAASLLLAAGGTGALAYVAGLPPFAATAPAAASAAARAAIPAAVAPAAAGGTAAGAPGGVAAGGLAPATGTAAGGPPPASGGPPPAAAGGASAAGGPPPAPRSPLQGPAGAAPPLPPPGPSALPSPRGWRGSGTAAPPAPHAFPAPTSPTPTPAPAAWPATPSVALVAEGDRRLAAPMASHLAAELERRGLHVLDRDSSLLLDAWTEGAPLAPLLRRLQGDGVAFLVRVRVEALGERSSRFLGRSEVAVASRLAVDAFLVPDQSGLGAGWDARVDYGEGDADRRAATLARDAAASLAPRLDAAWSDYRNRAGLGAVP